MIAASLVGAVRQVPEIEVSSVVVADGDSMISGTHGGGTSVTAKIKAILRGSDVTGVGVSGQKLWEMSADAAAEVDPLLDPMMDQNVCIVWGGTNDLQADATAAQVITRMETYCTNRQAAGWQVVLLTILPRSQEATPGTFEAARQTVNSSIRANWATYADALYDVAANTTIGDAGDETNTTYYVDLVHLTDYGRHIVTHELLEVLATLGVS